MPKGTQLASGSVGMLPVQSVCKSYALSHPPPLPPQVNDKTCRTAPVASYWEEAAALEVPPPPSSFAAPTPLQKVRRRSRIMSLVSSYPQHPISLPQPPATLSPSGIQGCFWPRICIRSAALRNLAAEAFCGALQSLSSSRRNSEKIRSKGRGRRFTDQRNYKCTLYIFTK